VPIAAANNPPVVFTLIFSLRGFQTVARKICLAKHYNFVIIAIRPMKAKHEKAARNAFESRRRPEKSI
jgi:hypothetical protein